MLVLLIDCLFLRLFIFVPSLFRINKYNVIFFQSSPPESQRHDPMVAMVCPSKQGDPVDRLFHNQYLSSSGKWATDFDHKATCTTDKVEILEYCKKVSDICWGFFLVSSLSALRLGCPPLFTV